MNISSVYLKSFITRSCGQRISACLFTTDVKENIEIPKRIHRGPTDILRALESTVKRDYTAAHYKYHDDPYLIPMSNLGKRTFAMAQEAGRKAAYWVRQENADLFQHQEADPMIKSFAPKIMYNESSEVTIQDLNEVIEKSYVFDAVTIYKLLKSKNVDVPAVAMQQLLELLCFYNHEEPLLEDFIEERWFKQSFKGKERQRKTWKDGDLAEEIFISFDNPNEEAYSAIIQGMAKYGQVDRSWQLFEEALSKNLLLSVDAYNSIIGVANFLKEAYDLRWTFVLDMLSMMAQAKVKPNLRTLNNVLKTLSTMGTSKIVKENALKTLAEFRAMNIEPSLASWYYILITFCKERGPVSPILKNIMNELEGKDLQIKDEKDTFFFVTAMDICHHHLHDLELANRVNNLLNLHNNYDLIGDSYKESIYYRHYITLLCKTETLEEFMQNTYLKLVPHIYVPEPSVMLEILKCVEANDAVEYIPRLWSDVIIFDHVNRENLINLVLNILVSSENAESATLAERFSTIAWDIWNKIENQNENKINKISFTGEMLGKIMTLLLKNDDFEKACIVMDKLQNDQTTVLGVSSFEALELFVNHCVKEKLPSKAISCIQYAVDSGFEDAANLAVTLNTSLTLDETHLSKLSVIVGPDVFK
ncbi:hypothetical protein RN001_006420 [Aquatica leii]|uniref:Small ribosomal subunit protein mS39 n=1 Tax=Aquatica leii TaxID=1421715 RepID=A0AAN7PL38_9COLE|nr:hypothetical protein RN001_006420 [Aquatica leii]